MTREVIFYTRKQCGLCDEAAGELYRLREALRFNLRELDIDDDADLRAQYNDIVPVIAIGDRVIAHAPVDLKLLREELTAAMRG